MIDRIINSYKKELADSEKLGEYTIAGIWTDKVWDNIEARLSNFGSDDVGLGISLKNNPPDEKKMASLFGLWDGLTHLPAKVIEYPDKFGLKGIHAYFGQNGKVTEVFTIPSATRVSYYAFRANELSEGNIIEIGTGFGGVPYHLFKDFNFNRTYLNFDIPSVNLVAKFFLMSMFPNKKFLLYGEDSIKNYAKYDIVLMPHFELRNLKAKSCDLVLNAHSLSEMGKEQIEEYMKQIARVSTKYFLHFNHDEQAYDLSNVLKNPLSLSTVKPEGWKKLGKWIETLSESNDIKYYEYLYEKHN